MPEAAQKGNGFSNRKRLAPDAPGGPGVPAAAPKTMAAGLSRRPNDIRVTGEAESAIASCRNVPPFKLLSSRTTLSEKSATFRDHALARRQHHGDLAALEIGLHLDLGDVGDFRPDPVQHPEAQIGVR